PYVSIKSTRIVGRWWLVYGFIQRPAVFWPPYPQCWGNHDGAWCWVFGVRCSVFGVRCSVFG
ncbi:MAG: hypothetical protein M3Y56_12600, partial [Armatimonadota bacterium]|nr:hypothetical protein [Armatimonadota bacterium]